ncbi:MAG: hypothetical protein COU11_01265 [Candidatus Harrisonbacteria bacterium CG10_big_fil_rev_8_21_14_0_10_49_15]|uniref:Peptidase M14 domain-containing protein n=1 Tax=Candidatus Harrisonbacteria bacterium CG10_big_fil_rev_8_21_14_0_10_49_15 TaxID=1974587 RepID=A0A2H0ULL0_9BACT|nr:MAG: hypothetical protein COU11_01265 [Candidatus Harrisonbacteria bacterium CG10_big_fil_rev_8_21_14_0_10_49_15]
MNKKTIITLVVIVVLALGAYLLFSNNEPVTPDIATPDVNQPTDTDSPATTTPDTAEDEGATVVIGKSVEGRDIVAYNYGSGARRVLFVGGIHGGYSWNTSLVAYEAMDYFEKNLSTIPEGITVTVIPNANPDGLSKVVSATGAFKASDITASAAVQVTGRFNANNVDLNRNFDCQWQATGTWQNKSVSGGTTAFSEPEAKAVRDYIDSHSPAGVVVWYSAAGGVYASSCGADVLPATTAMMNAYAQASGYPAHKSFDFYETTGDMANWLAKKNIPAISVLLTDHTSTEWTKNQAGIKAVLTHFSQ